MYTIIGNASSSFIKSLSFFLLFLGTVMLIIGNEKKKIKTKKIYPEKNIQKKSNQMFKNMFQDRDSWSSYKFYENSFPWEERMINSRVVTYQNDPISGLNKNSLNEQM